MNPTGRTKALLAAAALLLPAAAARAQDGAVSPPASLEEWIQRQIPGSLKETVVLLDHWQWIGLLALIVAGAVLEKTVEALVRLLFARLIRASSRKGPAPEGEAVESLRRNAERPFGVMALSGFFLLTLPYLLLPPTVHRLFSMAATVVLAVSGVWAAYRFVDVLSLYFLNLARGTATRLDDLLVPLVRRVSKVFVLAIGVIFVAQNLGLEVGSLLAGLGIGGLAFALAAKDTVANFFGSVTVLLDQPFQIGDWVVIGGVEGAVESVGFRSTRIRTADNSLITLPNSKLIDSVVDNYEARVYRIFRPKLKVDLATPIWKVEALCEGLRELVRLQPHTRKDSMLVSVESIGDAGVEIGVVLNFHVPDYETEIRERHRFLLDAMRTARRLGVSLSTSVRSPALPGGEAPESVAGPASAPPATEPPPEPAPATLCEALEFGRKAAREAVAETRGDGGTPPRAA